MRNLTGILLASALCFSLANAANDDCKKGDAKACFTDAKAYDKNGDSENAFEYYTMSCFMGYALGCDSLAQKYQNLNDIANAKKFYKKACDINHHESCVSLGEIYENEGDCVEASKIYETTFENKKYKPAYEKFKALNTSEKCAKIQAPTQETEEKISEDFAIKIYQCKIKKFSEVCMEVANSYLSGESEVRKDINKALQYYKIACEAENAGGCSSVSDIYKANGDNDLAIKYATLACNLDYGEVCAELAEIYYENADIKKAAFYYGKACVIGPSSGFDGIFQQNAFDGYCDIADKLENQLKR